MKNDSEALGVVSGAQILMLRPVLL